MAPIPVPDDSILRFNEVQAKVGLRRTTIYALIGRSEFPQSIPLGGRHVGWSANEINLWIAEQKAKRPVAA